MRSLVVTALLVHSSSAFNHALGAARSGWVRHPSLVVRRAEDGEKVALELLAVDAEYAGIVKRVSDFGCFVDFGAKSDGLVHKSQLADAFVANTADVVTIGQKVRIPCVFRLSKQRHKQWRL